MVHFVRHASHAHVGRVLTGRAPGVPLTPAGRGEAARLARRLALEDVAMVFSSPRERALETGRMIAAELDCPCETRHELDEIDFGGWTGLSFPELDPRPDWRAWNDDRSAARPPAGESMGEAQARIMAFVGGLATSCVLVSHCDVIKTALIRVLDLPLNAWSRFEISPASLSTIAFPADGGASVLRMNEVVR